MYYYSVFFYRFKVIITLTVILKDGFMLNILLRTVIVYALLVAAMRIGGKRQIGEMQISELVSALLLSELAAMPIGHEEIPLTFAIIPTVAVICIEIIAAFAVTKSKRLRTLFDGKPSIVIRKGKLDYAELSKLRLDIEELISEARLKGVSDISELEYAILEGNGELSVFPKAEVGSKGIAHIIVSDGEVNEYGLKITGLSRSALENRLKKKGLTLSELYLYTLNDDGDDNIIKKETKKQ